MATGRSGSKLGALFRALWLVLVARKDTRDFYDAFSSRYETLVGAQPNGADSARFVKEYFAKGKPARVLELGCGTGLYSQHIQSVGVTLHGVDFSAGQLRQMERRGLAMLLVQGDILKLPYRDASFDAVTSFQVLPHFPGQEVKFFQEAYRVLKPGGVFFLDPVSPVAKQARDGAFTKLLRAMSRGLLRYSRVKAWNQRPTQEYFRAGLKSVGFDVQTFERHYAKDWEFLVGTKGS